MRSAQTRSKLQRQLISSAFEALKVGGVLVYSTCTLNVQENEHVCFGKHAGLFCSDARTPQAESATAMSMWEWGVGQGRKYWDALGVIPPCLEHSGKCQHQALCQHLALK